MSIRTEKVAALIRQSVAEYLQRGLPEYLDGMVTITTVRVSADLSLARVYVSIWNSKTDPKILIKRLNLHQPEIRTAVARTVRLRNAPELKFFLDDTLDAAAKIDELIDRVRKEDDQRSGSRDGI